MKSLVQRLSPRKGSSARTLNGAIAAFHAHMTEAEDGDVGVELLSDRVVVQKTGATSTAPLRELLFAEIRSIEWNYRNGTVTFRDAADSLLVISLTPTLSQFEDSLTSALTDAKLPQLPATTYVGVFAGTKQPRVLQQLRPSLVPPHLRPKIPLALRRELLLADRPPSSSLVPPSRDALCLEFLRQRTMTFHGAASSSLVVTDAHLLLVQDDPSKAERIVPYDSIASIQLNATRTAVDLAFVDVADPPVSFATAEPAVVCQAVWYFLNHRPQLGGGKSAGVVAASVYGRPVYSSAGLATTASAHDEEDTSPASRWVKHQGPLAKTASEGFHLTQSWKKKHATLHDSPLGAWLSYAESADAKKTEPSSKRIDLASVLCIRPQSALPDAPPFSFDIVTLYRTWSFCAADEADHATWLRVLGDFVDRAAALAPDAPLSCEVKVALQEPLESAVGGQTVNATMVNATLTIASDGVRLLGAASVDVPDMEWYYTDIHKWSLVLQPQPSLFLSCFMDPACAKVGEFVLQTKNAAAMCQAIEFHVAKCLAKVDVLHEARVVQPDEAPPTPAPNTAKVTPNLPATTTITATLPPPPYQAAFHSIQPVVLPPLPPIQSFRRVSVA